MVRRDYQARLERVCSTTPPVDQLASVTAEIAAVGEPSVAAADYEQTAVTIRVLIAVRVDPSAHRHSVRIEVQARDRHPGGSGGITKAGGLDRVVGGFKSRKRARPRTDDAIEAVRRTHLIGPGKTARVVVGRRVSGGITRLIQPPVGDRIVRQHAVSIAAGRRSGDHC